MALRNYNTIRKEIQLFYENLDMYFHIQEHPNQEVTNKI